MIPYRICSKTIMDSSDRAIVFNEHGESDYYLNFRNSIEPVWAYGLGKEEQLSRIAEKIKGNNPTGYDCIIGISGGLDSSYAAYVVKEIMGLKPLLYHVDAGWNTSQSASNVRKLANGLNLDLVTDVIEWDEMRDLQLAFLKSQIPDQDIPQDTAFFSSLYKYAIKHKIKYVLTGGNFSTECCREPNEWGAYPGIDAKLIRDIHKIFGTKTLKTFPIVDVLKYKILNRFLYGMRVFKPLDLVSYKKHAAETLLQQKFGWQPFQHKHHESRFTRFFEDYWLPQKFGYDKRKVHFSSLILTGQMSREVALERIKKPEMSSEMLRGEIEYVSDKLDITIAQLNELMLGKNKIAYDYKNKMGIIMAGSKALRLFGAEKRMFR